MCCHVLGKKTQIRHAHARRETTNTQHIAQLNKARRANRGRVYYIYRQPTL